MPSTTPRKTQPNDPRTILKDAGLKVRALGGAFGRGTPWLEFIWGDLRVQALIFDEPSTFGIDNGPISKLWAVEINDGQRTTVLNYDRGWDVKPDLPEAQALLDEMHALFPARTEA